MRRNQSIIKAERGKSSSLVHKNMLKKAISVESVTLLTISIRSGSEEKAPNPSIELHKIKDTDFYSKKEQNCLFKIDKIVITGIKAIKTNGYGQGKSHQRHQSIVGKK